jgi:Zn-dependent protease
MVHRVKVAERGGRKVNKTFSLRAHALLLSTVFIAVFTLAGVCALAYSEASNVKIQLCMVVDGSSSIDSSEWTIIKGAIAKAINNTLPHDGSVEFSIVQFGYQSSKGYANIEVSPTILKDDNYASVADQALSMPKGGGSTPTAHGLSLGWKELRNSDNFGNLARQVINLVTDEKPNIRNNNATADMDGSGGPPNAEDDLISTVNNAISDGLDELDIEGINLGDSSLEWFQRWIVYPQPGIQAPPFSKPGWIRNVADATEFADTIDQKMQSVIAQYSFWAPSSWDALAATTTTVATTSVLAIVSANISSPEAGFGGSVWSRIVGALPDSVKNWLQSYGEEVIASKTQKEVEKILVPRAMITRMELFTFVFAAFLLTFCFAYASTPGMSEFLSTLPMAFATAAVVEMVYWLSMEIVARSLGIWAEYRIWPVGIAMLLISALAFKSPFCVAGRCKFQSPTITKKSVGLTSLFGPASILILGAVFTILLQYGYEQLGNLGVMICLTKAAFDMFPIPPMNGKEVFSWNKVVWLSFFILSIALYIFFILSF